MKILDTSEGITTVCTVSRNKATTFRSWEGREGVILDWRYSMLEVKSDLEKINHSAIFAKTFKQVCTNYGYTKIRGL